MFAPWTEYTSWGLNGLQWIYGEAFMSKGAFLLNKDKLFTRAKHLTKKERETETGIQD